MSGCWIKSRWERKNGRLVYSFTVPANTTATIRLPLARQMEEPAQGLKRIRLADGPGGKVAVYDAIAGTHTLAEME